ncbi:CPBP family intramembrane glutamic endopeptidase [Clostridium hydrogenum]|uniref:CPBP family intramembrane glutamic endopeptidase n=1 Tax=Clostridium hydrogenum TaxID=2855764 RepID=UPI001F1BEE4D|nr:CPBP family intramembrane glutamic endopeptidase [Clostridium hydrogenum]
MYRLKEKLKNKQILLFLITTFTGTYLLWGILLLSSKGILSKVIYRNSAYNTFLHVLGASMPSIMGIVFTGYFGGVKKIKRLLKKLTNWKFNIIFYLLSLVTLNAQLFLSYFIFSIVGFNIKVFVNHSFQGFKTDTILGIFVLFIVIVLFGGPIQEEFGWRGFLLPRLQKKFHPVFSAVIVGVVWSIWHLPMFFISGSGYNDFLIYMVETIILSIEITWIYNKTNGSLLFPVLIHGIDNTYGVVLGTSGNKTMLAYIVVIVIAFFIVIDMCRKNQKGVWRYE